MTQFQAIEIEQLGKNCLSKISIIAFNYFLIELNKTYSIIYFELGPNLSISSLNMYITERQDKLIEILITSNDEKSIIRFWNIEEYINFNI